MKINWHNTVHSHRSQELSDVARTDGDSRLHFTILSCIAVIRNDRSDRICWGFSQGWDQQEKLHEVIIDGLAGGLDDEYVFSSDRFFYLDFDLSIWKFAYKALS